MNILITGVTSGFGLAIAKRLIGENHIVIGTGRRADKLAKIKGVDVSGGIEKEKGVKCGVKMGGFMGNIKV